MATATLQAAVSKAEHLSLAAQDKLGRDLIERVEKMQALRSELELGIQSLDRGEGSELDIDDVISRARAQHVGR